MVTVLRAATPITSKTAAVKTTCSFSFSATVVSARVGRSRKLAVRIRFNGNSALSPVTKVGSIRVKS